MPNTAKARVYVPAPRPLKTSLESKQLLAETAPDPGPRLKGDYASDGPSAQPVSAAQSSAARMIRSQAGSFVSE